MHTVDVALNSDLCSASVTGGVIFDRPEMAVCNYPQQHLLTANVLTVTVLRSNLAVECNSKQPVPQCIGV